GGKARLAPDFEVVAVEPLLSDAIAHDDDDIAFFQEELLSRDGRRGAQEQSGDQEASEFSHEHDKVLSKSSRRRMLLLERNEGSLARRIRISGVPSPVRGRLRTVHNPVSYGARLARHS